MDKFKEIYCIIGVDRRRGTIKKSALIILIVGAFFIVFTFQNCGKTEKNQISAQTQQDILDDQIESLGGDPDSDVTFEFEQPPSVNSQGNLVDSSPQIVTKRGNVVFTNNDEVEIVGDFDIPTPRGPVRHHDVNLRGKVKPGKKDSVLTIFDVSGEVYLNLVDNPGLDYIKGRDEPRLRARLFWIKGKDFNKKVVLPLKPETYYVVYEFNTGLYTKAYGIDLDIPRGAVTSYIVINPDTGLTYLEGTLEGAPGIKSPIQKAGIGLSPEREIKYIPQSSFAFNNKYNYFAKPQNFWKGFLPDAEGDTTLIQFDGNLFAQAKGTVKVKGVPVNVKGDLTFRLTNPEQHYVGSTMGLNGEAWIGFRAGGIDISIPLGEASVAYGEASNHKFAYVSGEVEPGLRFSPAAVDIRFGPEAKAAALLHEDMSNTFVDIQADIGVSSINLSGGQVRINSSGFLLAGQYGIGSSNVIMKGKVDDTGIDLKGQVSLEFPMIGTQKLLQTVTDAVHCGTQIIKSGPRCGWKTAKNIHECGSEFSRNAAECGTESIKNAALCGENTGKNALECGQETVTSIPECGFTIVEDAGCIAGCLIGSCSCSFKSAKTCTVDKSCTYPLTCIVGKACSWIKTCTFALSCPVPKTCDITKSLDPNTNFGSVKATIDLGLIGTGSVQVTGNAKAELCDSSGTCKAIDSRFVDLDMTDKAAPKVCIGTDFLDVPHQLDFVEPRVCAPF